MNDKFWLTSILKDALDQALDECVLLEGGRKVQLQKNQHSPKILGREQTKAPQGRLIRAGSIQTSHDIPLAA